MADTPTPAANATLGTEATYAHMGTFLRLAPGGADLTGMDDAFMGVPFDTATTFRPGARFGPGAIRAGSAQLVELRSFPDGINPKEHRRAVDCGDVKFDPALPSGIPRAIEAEAARIIAAGCFLTSFGGDHFVTYPLLKAHVAKHGKLALVHFDAHPDTWAESKGKEIELNHGTMFTRAIREGLIVPGRSVQVGIRTWVDDTRGMNLLSAPFVHAEGVKATLARILEIVGDHPAYLTVDIDAIDPAFAPGTGTPVAGGLTTAQMFAILRGLGALDIRGMDVVEVAPAYDQAEITAIAGATIAYDQFCLRALKSGAKSRAR